MRSGEEEARKVKRPPLVCLCPAGMTMPISQGPSGTKHHKSKIRIFERPVIPLSSGRG
jgi:hypothetical protein